MADARESDLPPAGGAPLCFGNFEVLADEQGRPRLLGEGNFGRTYLARHRFLDHQVALKVIHERIAGDATARRRFLSEGRALKQLEHPHVAGLEDFGEANGTLYYAMEYCAGGNLAARVQARGPMAPGEVMEVGRQILGALAAAHAMGFVHRDLKPSNLMLRDAEGPLWAKLIDFGLVHAIAPDVPAPMGQTGEEAHFAGTPLFASPEQLNEEALDGRSDLFSLGLTLWFLATGTTPESGSPAVIASGRLNAESYAGRLPAALPSGFRAFLARLLEKKREQRFQSAVEALAVLEAGMSGRPAPGAKIGGGWGRAMIGASVASVLAVGALAAWQWKVRHAVAPHAQPAPTPVRVAPVAATPAPAPVAPAAQTVLRLDGEFPDHTVFSVAGRTAKARRSAEGWTLALPQPLPAYPLEIAVSAAGYSGQADKLVLGSAADAAQVQTVRLSRNSGKVRFVSSGAGSDYSEAVFRMVAPLLEDQGVVEVDGAERRCELGGGAGATQELPTGIYQITLAAKSPAVLPRRERREVRAGAVLDYQLPASWAEWFTGTVELPGEGAGAPSRSVERRIVIEPGFSGGQLIERQGDALAAYPLADVRLNADGTLGATVRFSAPLFGAAPNRAYDQRLTARRTGADAEFSFRESLQVNEKVESVLGRAPNDRGTPVGGRFAVVPQAERAALGEADAAVREQAQAAEEARRLKEQEGRSKPAEPKKAGRRP